MSRALITSAALLAHYALCAAWTVLPMRAKVAVYLAHRARVGKRWN
jgi:hypothetical protein